MLPGNLRPFVWGVASLLLLGACSDDPQPSETDTDTGADSDTADTGGEAAPLIHEAELCEEANPSLSVAPGSDLMKVTLDAPRAVCNDGSPAVIYVRPAPTGSANADRWILWLESGGGCNSATACRSRWCGDTIAKMTSRFAPDGIRGNGIFADRPANDFADWNHVVAYYCSSDSWSGRQRTLAIDDTGTTPRYELYVHGAYIVDEIINALKTGAESDDGSMSMASIDDASMFLLTGTSAGAGGVRSNADRVGEILRQTNPSVDYRIIVDAGVAPVDPHPPELPETDALAMLDFKHELIVNWRNGATDESCLEYHDGDERWCSENSHLMFHHITTPAFVKQDLRDAAPGPYADARTYSAVMHEWFSNVAAETFIPEESDVALDTFGLFVPSCDHHLNLNVTSFYDIRLTNGADELSMHDLSSNWVRGAQPSQAIHNPTGGLTSVCP